MSRHDADSLLTEVRGIQDQTLQPGEHAAWMFRDLLQVLLSATILADGQHVTIAESRRSQGAIDFAYGGPSGVDSPLKLNDEKFLWLVIHARITSPSEGQKLCIQSSKYQYQVDSEARLEIFRYEYTRRRPCEHPTAHLHVFGSFDQERQDVLPENRPLHKVHFPTDRVSLEGVIQLLADQFNVPCNKHRDIWHPVLIQTESTFITLARRAPSCIQSEQDGSGV